MKETWCQKVVAADVAQGIDAGHVCVLELVHFDGTLRVQLNALRRVSENQGPMTSSPDRNVDAKVGGGVASNCIQHRVQTADGLLHKCDSRRAVQGYMLETPPFRHVPLCQSALSKSRPRS